MLEKIRLMLNINDDKYDRLINLYIEKVTNMVFEYCNILTLTTALESFVEDKVVDILKGKVGASLGTGTENTGEIKSITRGDTRIEYNVSSSSSTVVEKVTGAMFTESEKIYLNTFRRLRVF